MFCYLNDQHLYTTHIHVTAVVCTYRLYKTEISAVSGFTLNVPLLLVFLALPLASLTQLSTNQGDAAN